MTLRCNWQSVIPPPAPRLPTQTARRLGSWAGFLAPGSGWAGCIPPAIQQRILALPAARFERTRGEHSNVSSFYTRRTTCHKITNLTTPHPIPPPSRPTPTAPVSPQNTIAELTPGPMRRDAGAAHHIFPDPARASSSFRVCICSQAGALLPGFYSPPTRLARPQYPSLGPPGLYVVFIQIRAATNPTAASFLHKQSYLGIKP